MKARPITFRIYPEKGTRYALVTVWPTKRAMQNAMRRGGSRPGRHTQAFCTGVEVIQIRKGRPQRKLGIFAEVNFHRNRLGMEVITHELFHATIAYGRRIKFDWSRLGDDDAVNKDEERLTYVHGVLCREFVVRAQAAGLYDD